jgi:hypothetical protein
MAIAMLPPLAKKLDDAEIAPEYILPKEDEANQNKLAIQLDATTQKEFENHLEPTFLLLAHDKFHQNTFLMENLSATDAKLRKTIKLGPKKLIL